MSVAKKDYKRITTKSLIEMKPMEKKSLCLPHTILQWQKLLIQQESM